jgi:hypothetical protein
MMLKLSRVIPSRIGTIKSVRFMLYRNMEGSLFDLVNEVERLGRLGELYSGELAAGGLFHRLVVEFHGLDLLGYIRVRAFDVDRIADSEVAEIQLQGRDGTFIEIPEHGPDAFFHGRNNSIKPPGFQGKRSNGCRGENAEKACIITIYRLDNAAADEYYMFCRKG